MRLDTPCQSNADVVVLVRLDTPCQSDADDGVLVRLDSQSQADAADGVLVRLDTPCQSDAEEGVLVRLNPNGARLTQAMQAADSKTTGSTRTKAWSQGPVRQPELKTQTNFRTRLAANLLAVPANIDQPNITMRQ